MIEANYSDSMYEMYECILYFKLYKIELIGDGKFNSTIIII